MINAGIWQLLEISGSILGVLISVILLAVKLLIGQFEKRLNKSSTQLMNNVKLNKNT